MKIRIIIIATLFLFCSCSLFNSDESKDGIYGVWFASNGNVGFKISVSEATTAVNPFISNGNIAISGSVNENLEYMWVDEVNYTNNYLIISNYPTARVTDIIIYIIINLSVDDDNLIINIYSSDDEVGDIVLYGTINYDFDGENITINNYNITSDDIQLTLNGSNSLELVELNPGVETSFMLSSDLLYNESRTVDIKESGTVIWNQTLHSNGELDKESGTISMEDLWGFDELNWTYSLEDEDTLILSLNTDLCPTGDVDCIAGYVWNFNLDPTIVDSIILFDECVFSSAD